MTIDMPKLRALIGSRKWVVVGIAIGLSATASAQQSADSLTKRKHNPVAGLRQVILDVAVTPNAPVTGKTVGDYSVQIIWPFALTKDLHVVTYTIVPAAQLPVPDAPSIFGLGDALINVFVTARQPSSFVWGVGPAVLLPTRTHPDLGTNRPALGPALVLNYDKDAGGAGIVVGNAWSLGGSGLNELNEFAAQYFLTVNLPRGWFVYCNATITSDWTANAGERWTVPLAGGPGKLFRIGKQSMSFSLQGAWNAVTPRGDPRWYLSPQFSWLFS
jgi:hypothetical protein